MSVKMTPEEFIKKWTAANLSESSAAQQHFLDLCSLLGQLTPAEADPTGDTFTFEKGGTTATGGHGWADVWKKGAFAWEYKGPGKDLNAAYFQLKKYADMLENPPLLITSDTKRIEVHTNFTNTVKSVFVIELQDLTDPAKRELLRAAFTEPEKLRPGVTRQQVTKEAAENFSQLAHHLQNKGYEPHRVAHFLNRLIFCMFAEDVGLLPNRIFSKLVTASVAHPHTFEVNAKQLFGGMAKGGTVAFEVIDWFNGGLFDDDSTLPLDATELKLVLQCAQLDWSNVEPSIFGTLFERGLDPDKRSQQGAHYTDLDTIMKLVKPVVVDPWERAWEQERTAIAKQIDRAKKTVSEAAKQRYYAFLEKLATFRVLDPACGSGNFLYLSLRALKGFEKRVVHDAETLGLAPPFPRVGPEAVLGIEVNPYAAELARVTIWIGELQWMLENGFAAAKNPLLKPLDQIECRDAIVTDSGAEPDWPSADVIVGNPPFLGNKKLRRELGDEYVQRLRLVYEGRVPAGVDLVTYWFEKAAKQLVDGKTSRVGLVATQGIRGGTNRRLLARVLERAAIFNAWSSEPWVNEGAAVRVALICFEPGEGARRPAELNGQVVNSVNSDLSPGGAESHSDMTRVQPLRENEGVIFQGIKFVGAFAISGEQAREWLRSYGNPNGRPNSDVLRRWVNGDEFSKRRPQDGWLIDFGTEMPQSQASMYELPFGHLLATVRSVRTANREQRAAQKWWLHQRPRPAMRSALGHWPRYIAIPEVSKYHVVQFVAPTSVLPSGSVYAVARSDFSTLGVLQSRIHEIWALRMGTRLEDRPRYTSTTTFETFPFPTDLTPNVPAEKYAADPVAQVIAAAANRLCDLRENWLNPSELVGRVPEVVAGYPDRLLPKNEAAAKELKRRTVTNLYSAMPPWLKHAHAELDAAVAAAYGWEWPLADDEILKRLFQLNQQRGGL